MENANRLEKAAREMADALVGENHTQPDAAGRDRAAQAVLNVITEDVAFLERIKKAVANAVAGLEPDEDLRVEGYDNHGVATAEDLPDIWEFLNELCAEEPERRLLTLDEMSRDQKKTLLAMAVNDSKWVGEGKMGPNVQQDMIENGELDDCLTTSG